MQTKRCAECGGIFDIRFFGRDQHSRYAYLESGTRAKCLGCEQAARDARKQSLEGRWREKIRSTIKRHARRLGFPAAVLQERYGWALTRMLHDAQHAYQNGCCYCTKTFKSMGHGLADITLDILDPRSAPYYTTNIRWACATCNKEKSRTAPEDWGAKLAAYQQWLRIPKLPLQRALKFDDDDEGDS